MPLIFYNLFTASNVIKTFHRLLSGLSADTSTILGIYGGCPYKDDGGDDKTFWGCGVPGKNVLGTVAMDKFTTDTGCGNDLVNIISFLSLIFSKRFLMRGQVMS